jgi:putative hydrolase of the HAD superfamily
MGIKNIILDLGGVILNIDYHITIKAFQELGITDFDALYTQAKQAHLFDHYETGKIDSDEFIDKLSQYLKTQQPRQKIIEAWNAMLLDLPQERLTFLEKLKEKFNTTLLSNTNPIHIQCFHQIIKQQNNIDGLDAYFDHVHFSSDLGMRKPNPEIFTYVCDIHGYKPEETLFIDDSIQHVEGAKKAGINSYLLDTERNDVINLVSSLLA